MAPSSNKTVQVKNEYMTYYRQDKSHLFSTCNRGHPITHCFCPLKSMGFRTLILTKGRRDS